MSRCTDTCCRPGYEDAPEVIDLGERGVKARIEHTCAHCSAPIRPGTVYVRRAFRVDGDVVVEKSHTGNGACGYDDLAADLAAIEREERDTQGATA